MSDSEDVSGPPLQPLDLVSQLMDVLRQVLPGAVETADQGRFGFGVAEGYKGLVFTVEPKPDRVNLGITGGATLMDPGGLLEGTGKRHRHIKLRSLDELRNQALLDLLERAAGRALDRQSG